LPGSDFPSAIERPAFAVPAVLLNTSLDHTVPEYRDAQIRPDCVLR